MELQLRCPSCGRTDQFIQSNDLNEHTPNDHPIRCVCGAVTTAGTLKANITESESAGATDAERLAREAAARAFGKLLE